MAQLDISEAPPHVQAVIRAYAALNQRDVDAVPELDEATTCTTRAQVRERLADLLRAFPDLTVWNLRAVDLGGGRVGVRFRLTGTNDGPLGAGRPPTGRKIEADMYDLIRFDANGRIVDGRNLSDLEPIGQQLGLT